MSKFNRLRLRQLDVTLSEVDSLRFVPPPDQGWVKTIREALGMSLRQLAERSGLSKTAVASAEVSESRGTIQLDSLKRLADGLNCDVVYALLPREPLQDMVERQAGTLATELVTRVSDSMDLEMQGISLEEQERQVEELKTEILRKLGRDFWNL